MTSMLFAPGCACPTRGEDRVLRAIRQVLAKMNISLVEPEKSGALDLVFSQAAAIGTAEPDAWHRELDDYTAQHM